MFQVRFHGRGGQGVVTAADLLALAAFEDGLFAQAFPSFGSERTGAPVVSYCRLGHQVIRTRAPVVEPDALVVLDPTLVHQVELFSGLRSEGYVLVNTTRTLDELGLAALADGRPSDRLATVPATELARCKIGRPLANAAILGSFAALTERVSIGAITSAIRDRFQAEPELAEVNVVTAIEAFMHVRRGRGMPLQELVSGADSN